MARAGCGGARGRAAVRGVGPAGVCCGAGTGPGAAGAARWGAAALRPLQPGAGAVSGGSARAAFPPRSPREGGSQRSGGALTGPRPGPLPGVRRCAAWPCHSMRSISAAGEAGALGAALAAAALFADLGVLPRVAGGVLGPSGLLAPFAAALGASAGLGVAGVPVLRRLRAGQVVRADGPSSHLASKSGTPTLGGLLFVPPSVLAAAWVGGWGAGAPDVRVVAVCACSLACGLVGLCDDLLILSRGSSQGLPANAKFAALLTVATALCAWGATRPTPVVALPFGLPTLRLGRVSYWVLGAFAVLSEANAVNLADGLDGLAAGTSAVAFAGLGLALAGDREATMAGLCFAFAGGCCGFLLHNRHPARIFMGDTGALALGGALGAAGVLCGAIVPLLAVSAVFAAEAASVALQVAYFKYTRWKFGAGRRILRMSPLHHHFELGGAPERRVVRGFWAAGLAAAVLATILAVS